MKVPSAAWFALGFVGCMVLLRPDEDSCCRRVSNGVRDKVTEAVGGWAGPIGDALGLWDRAPAILDWLPRSLTS